MTRTKHLVIGVFVLACLVGAGIGIFAAYQTSFPESGMNDVLDTADRDVEDSIAGIENGRISQPSEPLPPEKIKADMFTGTLEVVDTGCFADGECFVVVDGKHVTVIMGWSQETVGSVIGVEGFGDLETFIGSDMEVYAHEKEDGTYSLYGSEGFYIKLLDHTVSEPGNEGIRIGEPYPGVPEEDPGIQDEAKPQVVKGGCMVGGCSSQLCGEAAAMSDMVTTCEYRAEYACYQVATCERQSNGQCGWTMTDELTQCLMHAEHMAGMEVS